MDMIPFDRGGSQAYVACTPGVQLQAKAFGDEKKKKDRDTELNITEPKYCPKVLVGNWYEDRIRCECRSQNEKVESNSKDPINGVEKKETPSETARKIKIKLYGEGPDLIRHSNNNEYLNNYATCYDLMYRVLSDKNLDGPRIRKYNGRFHKWLPEQDITKCYGNITGYGMKEYVKGLQDYAKYESKERLLTNYQCDYAEKEIPNIKRFYVKRGVIDKPDWNNLGSNSDLHSYWDQLFAQRLRKMDLGNRLARGKY